MPKKTEERKWKRSLNAVIVNISENDVKHNETLYISHLVRISFLIYVKHFLLGLFAFVLLVAIAL